MECNIGQDAIFFTHSELLYFLGIFIKGRLVKISENIAFLFYKARKRTRDKQYGGIMLNTCCKEIWLNVIVTD
jgi:hypothetical protein